MNEIIVNELPDTCGDCGFHDFVTDPDGPDIHYCKACEYLGLDDEMGNHNSEYDKNYSKIRDTRCPLKLKGYVSPDLAVKIVNLLLSVKGEDRENLNEILAYFLNIKKEGKE
ncbi:MAG: hypothetical protein J6Y02_04660 [Pseudobutyrivibrio sp.]|nr:hypothetical protein [Pseudobutyrivibrio sp.]